MRTTLVKQKVRLLCAVAGKFSQGPAGERLKEPNIVTDAPSARKVFDRWPTPVVVSGFEVGNAILYPSRSILQDYCYAPHHPLADATACT
jgi:inosine-uridine nucleoside N-ribohydrolase